MDVAGHRAERSGGGGGGLNGKRRRSLCAIIDGDVRRKTRYDAGRTDAKLNQLVRELCRR